MGLDDILQEKRDRAAAQQADYGVLVSEAQARRFALAQRVATELGNALKETGDPALSSPIVQKVMGAIGVSTAVQIDCQGRNRMTHFQASVTCKPGAEAVCSAVEVTLPNRAQGVFRPTKQGGFTPSAACVSLSSKSTPPRCIRSSKRWRVGRRGMVFQGEPDTNGLQHFAQLQADISGLLAKRLGATPDNVEKFGHGTFVSGMEYGERGHKGDLVFYVSRDDAIGHPRSRLRFAWRAYTAAKIVDKLIAAYEALKLNE